MINYPNVFFVNIQNFVKLFYKTKPLINNPLTMILDTQNYMLLTKKHINYTITRINIQKYKRKRFEKMGLLW